MTFLRSSLEARGSRDGAPRAPQSEQKGQRCLLKGRKVCLQSAVRAADGGQSNGHKRASQLSFS